MYDGYLNFGGNEVANNARTMGYAGTADCPMWWFKGEVCEGIWDALAETDLYTYTSVVNAPWYDSANPESARFFGVFIIDVHGEYNSTRRVTVTEGVGHGGVLGPTRKAVRDLRVKAMVAAEGLDALEYGMAWLSRVLDPGTCGQHGTGCGTVDLAFFADCPPTRASITMPQTDWELVTTNLAPNPSFEAGAGAPATVRTNQATNPSFEAVTAATSEVRRNQILNPSMEADAAGWAAYQLGGDGQAFRTTEQAVAGTGSLKVIAGTTPQTYAGATYNTPSLSLGTYTMSAWVRLGTAWASGVQCRVIDVDNVQTAGAVGGVVGSWVRISWTFTTVNPGIMRLFFCSAGQAPVANSYFYLDGVMLETGPLNYYFDGATVPGGDFTYAWTGAVNNSPSVQYGLNPPGVPASIQNCVAIQSSEWAASGTKSIRVIPNSQANSSTRYGTLAAFGLVQGKTYTVMATCRLPVAQTGTLNARARSLSLNQGGIIAQAPNVPGVYPLRITFTYDGTTITSAGTLSLYNGASQGGGDVWWDDLLIIEGTYTGPYFDGSTPAMVRRNYASNSAPINLSGWGVAGGTFEDGWAKSVAPSAVTAYIFSTWSARSIAKGEVLTIGIEYVVDALGTGTPPAAINFQPHIRSSNTYLSPRSHRPIVLGQIERVTITWTADRDIPANDFDMALLSASANGSNMTAPAGFTYRARRVLIEPGVSDGSWFDGDTLDTPTIAYAWEGTAHGSAAYAYDPDFTYDWSPGPANASMSRQRIETVAVYGPGAAIDGQSGVWSKDRGKSLRLISSYPTSGSAFLDIANHLGDRGLQRGVTYTMSAVLRMDQVQGAMGHPTGRSLQITGTTGGYNRTVAGLDQVGEQQLDLVFTVPPTGNWYLRIYNGAAMGGPDTWFDNLIIVEGEEPVPYFDGETPDVPPSDVDQPVGTTLERYSWTGAVETSASTHEAGRIIAVEDPDTWEELTTDLYRYMHDTGAVSGPLVTGEFEAYGFWANEVEFVFVSERPYVFKATKPVPLPPGSPIVVQDIPYNLMPYPSAELSTGTVVVSTNYSPNPSLEVNATGWSGNSQIMTPAATGARSTELASVGGASFKVSTITTNASAAASSMWATHVVPLPAYVAGQRFSISAWMAAQVPSGTAVITQTRLRAEWKDSGGVIVRNDTIGYGPIAGGVVAAKSLDRPPTAVSITVVAIADIASFSVGANLVLYVDAVAVTVP